MELHRSISFDFGDFSKYTVFCNILCNYKEDGSLRDIYTIRIYDIFRPSACIYIVKMIYKNGDKKFYPNNIVYHVAHHENIMNMLRQIRDELENARE